MKITDIKTHILKSPLDEPFAFSQGVVRTRSASLVEITTDTGLTGWGEAFTQGLESPEIAESAITHAFAPLVIGETRLIQSGYGLRCIINRAILGVKGQ